MWPSVMAFCSSVPSEEVYNYPWISLEDYLCKFLLGVNEFIKSLFEWRSCHSEERVSCSGEGGMTRKYGLSSLEF